MRPPARGGWAGAWGRVASLALVASLVAFALPVRALVPTAARVEQAIAEANRASGRDHALRLELTLQIGERTAVATGELISHPTGLARLELRGAGGLVERHLLQGSEQSASRNGQMLEEHRTFLPPFFLLQAHNDATLRAALSTFGVLYDVVGLGECGEIDCLVLGDPSREVPRPPLPQLPGLSTDLEIEIVDETDPAGLVVVEGGAQGAAEQRGPGIAAQLPIPRVWVDAETYEVRGIDTAPGVRIRLGPVVSFSKLRVPAWIEIEEPGKAPARFDVVNAQQVNAAASAFTTEWLLGPVPVSDAPAEAGAP